MDDHNEIFNARLRGMIGQQVIDRMSLEVRLELAEARLKELEAPTKVNTNKPVTFPPPDHVDWANAPVM